MRRFDPDEIKFYGNVAAQESDSLARESDLPIVSYLTRASLSSDDEIRSFPRPVAQWIDATYDSVAQLEAYEHLAPLDGTLVVQLGGRGAHALKLLLAGASRGVLVTPVLAEAKFASELAELFGLSTRFEAIVGTAEDLPLRSMVIDRIVSGGCVHHMNTETAFAEAARVLKAGGAFAAWDPWEAPLYRVGIAVFGKREPGVTCEPLNSARVASLVESFDWSRVSQHGALTRYAMLALGKMRIRPSLWACHQVAVMDDRVTSMVLGTRRFGSSVALLAKKSAPRSVTDLS